MGDDTLDPRNHVHGCQHVGCGHGKEARADSAFESALAVHRAVRRDALRQILKNYTVQHRFGCHAVCCTRCDCGLAALREEADQHCAPKENE